MIAIIFPGKFLGYTWLPEYESRTLLESLKEGAMPAGLADKMNRYRESVICDEDAFLFDDPSTGRRPEKHLMYVPIYGAAAERLGTVLLVRFHAPFVVRDVLLAEYLGSLVGIEMLNDRNRTIEEHSRDRIAARQTDAQYDREHESERGDGVAHLVLLTLKLNNIYRFLWNRFI